MFLTILTFISAISISIIAAGYSIIGLATLFAGAAMPIIAMGSALEIGKLVAASWLYNNWSSTMVPKSSQSISIYSNYSFSFYNINGYLWVFIKGTPRPSTTNKW
jgi:hypothetical protein